LAAWIRTNALATVSIQITMSSRMLAASLRKKLALVSTERKKKFLINKKIKRPFILAHGRIIPDKNYIDIIPMMKKLEGYDLIISGSIEENYKKKIEDRIKINGLENRVKILGRISKEDLLMYYNTASLFLMPAHKEDFGLTVIEAIASGTPVIAWDDHAGPSEILNSKCGILAKPYKEEEFLKSVKKGLSHKWDRKEVGKQANRFREQEISKQFLKEVEKII
jgi:glycosyltransferase involved in cell wall biosynthesis